VTGLFWATGVHDTKQKGRAKSLKNQGLRPKVPAAKQRKETGLSEKSGVLAPSGRLVPAASMPATPRGLGISGKRKGPEIFRAFLYGGGVRTRVQIRSPRPLGKYRVIVPAFGDCPFHIVQTSKANAY